MSEQLRVVNSTLEMVEQLEQVQRICFPSLSEAEIMTAAHYAAHFRLFPEGQFAVLNQANEVIACSTDFITTVDFEHIEHKFLEVTGHLWLTNHNSNGDWLYGVDIGVLPAYRGRGVAGLLYQARWNLIRRLNLRGHVAGGMFVGYGKVKDQMSIEKYAEKVKSGEIFDATVSIQLKRGFHIHGIIYEYVVDPSCDNKAAFIVWHNPDYR